MIQRSDMEWKASVAIGVGMFALAIIGLMIRADMRIVEADVLGAIGASAIAVLAYRGRKAAAAVPAVAAVILAVIAFLAVTSHTTPWLTALTLAGAFAFGFVAWTSMSSTRREDVGRRRPRPT
jgi:hypothetical protein